MVICRLTTCIVVLFQAPLRPKKRFRCERLFGGDVNTQIPIGS